MDMYGALFAKAMGGSGGGGGGDIIYIGFDWNAGKLDEGYDFATISALLSSGKNVCLKKVGYADIYQNMGFDSSVIYFMNIIYSLNLSKVMFSQVRISANNTIEKYQAQK